MHRRLILLVTITSITALGWRSPEFFRASTFREAPLVTVRTKPDPFVCDLYNKTHPHCAVQMPTNWETLLIGRAAELRMRLGKLPIGEASDSVQRLCEDGEKLRRQQIRAIGDPSVLLNETLTYGQAFVVAQLTPVQLDCRDARYRVGKRDVTFGFKHPISLDRVREAHYLVFVSNGVNPSPKDTVNRVIGTWKVIAFERTDGSSMRGDVISTGPFVRCGHPHMRTAGEPPPPATYLSCKKAAVISQIVERSHDQLSFAAAVSVYLRSDLVGMRGGPVKGVSALRGGDNLRGFANLQSVKMTDDEVEVLNEDSAKDPAWMDCSTGCCVADSDLSLASSPFQTDRGSSWAGASHGFPSVAFLPQPKHSLLELDARHANLLATSP